MRVLIVDNYDSFTYNLLDLIKSSQPQCSLEVFKNDVPFTKIKEFDPQAIILSPGPGTPMDSGVCLELIRELHPSTPILGVCLGMQALNQVFGGHTVHAPIPVHGKVAQIHHQERGIFKGIPSPLTVARYHSLVINPSEAFEVTAHCNGLPMAIAHRQWPLWGVQFHPESFLSLEGEKLIHNFFQQGVSS